MDLDQALWNSKTSGHKIFIMLMVCLPLLILSIVILLLCASNGMEDMTIVMVIVTAMVILASAAVVLVGKFTKLKWNKSNLIFALANDGLYFTGTINQDSYFYAEWSEISGYYVVEHQNGKATVTVNFNCVQDMGSFGKNTCLDMVGVTGAEELCKVFESFGIARQ